MTMDPRVQQLQENDLGLEQAPLMKALGALNSVAAGYGVGRLGGGLAEILGSSVKKVSALKPSINKSSFPWDLTPEEFAAAEAKGMGRGGSWNNAARDDFGRIHVSSREHGDLIPKLRDRGLVGDGADKPQYRGWVWQGVDPKKTFIDVSDLERSGGDFYKAYLSKANR